MAALFSGFALAGLIVAGRGGVSEALLLAQLLLPLYLTAAIHGGAYAHGALRHPALGIGRALRALLLAGAIAVSLAVVFHGLARLSYPLCLGSPVLAGAALAASRPAMHLWVCWRYNAPGALANGESVDNES